MWWMAVAVLYVTVMGVAATPPRSSSLVGPLLWQQVVACVAALSAAYGAFLTVVPGRRVGGALIVCVASVAVWTTILVVASLAKSDVPARVTSETDWPCVVSMLVGGGALVALMLAMLRRGALLTPGQTGALVATAAAAVGSVGACIARPHAFPSTILVWHGATATVLVLLLVVSVPHFDGWPGNRSG
jgi:hypothetical protein